METARPQPKVFLEDLDLESTTERGKKTAVSTLTKQLARWLFDKEDDAIFVPRLCVVDDETMAFLWETATQVDARNRIGENGVVAKGQLWWEESLPAETVLIGLVSATGSRRKDADGDADHFLMKYAVRASDLQFGGKSTVGRGRMRMLPKA
jgi:CRISPR-associated protein Cmr4